MKQLNRELIRREVVAAYRERERRRLKSELRAQRCERIAKWAYIIGAPLFILFLFILGTNP